MAYATLAQLKQYLGVTGASDDALLTRLLDAATSLIDARCARTFEASSGTKRVMHYMIVGRDIILPDDLRAVSTVTTDEGDILTATHFEAFDPPTRTLRVKDNAPSWRVRNSLTVTGTWGYMAAPSEEIAQACIRLAAWMYRQKDAQTFDLSGVAQAGQMTVQARIPADIEATLARYVVHGVLVT